MFAVKFAYIPDAVTRHFPTLDEATAFVRGSGFTCYVEDEQGNILPDNAFANRQAAYEAQRAADLEVARKRHARRIEFIRLAASRSHESWEIVKALLAFDGIYTNTYAVVRLFNGIECGVSFGFEKGKHTVSLSIESYKGTDGKSYHPRDYREWTPNAGRVDIPSPTATIDGLRSDLQVMHDLQKRFLAGGIAEAAWNRTKEAAQASSIYANMTMEATTKVSRTMQEAGFREGTTMRTQLPGKSPSGAQDRSEGRVYSTDPYGQIDVEVRGSKICAKLDGLTVEEFARVVAVLKAK